MKVKDVMTQDVKSCGLDSDLSMAARAMWMRDCGMLPVVDDDGQVVGIITARDICIATASKNREPSSIPVNEVITRKIHACSPDADIREALQIMQEKQVRRLPVIDAKGKLCGILSLDDVAIKVRAAGKPAELSAEDVLKTMDAIYKHRPTQEHSSQQVAA